jgi:hypothetical protein
MAALTILAVDKTLSDAARTELDTMLTQGTTGGGTIPAPYAGLTVTPSAALDMYQMVVIAALRIFKRVAGDEPGAGPPYPARVPSYAKASLPAAATFTGCLIYVSDESGGAVLAFSDGTNWRRVTDRAIVT